MSRQHKQFRPLDQDNGVPVYRTTFSYLWAIVSCRRPYWSFDVYAGNHYKQGSIIAEIDPRDFHIRKERAEAIYHQAKAEFERIEKLYEKNNVSASTYEKTKADYTTAKTAFDTASNELGDTRLTAPFDGYVGEVYIEKYQDVKPAQPVISFIDINRLKIEIYVTQNIAFASHPTDSVRIYFDAQPDKCYKAQIVEVSKGTTRNNLSYLLTAVLPNKEGKLLAGMSGKQSLMLPEQRIWQVFPFPKRHYVIVPRKVNMCGLLIRIPDKWIDGQWKKEICFPVAMLP